MKQLPFRIFGLVLVGGLIGLTALARDDAPKSDKVEKNEKSEKKVATAKAERGPIKSEASFKGMFVAGDTVEVSVKPEVWSSLSVLKAVEAGTKVQAGDVLVEFDPEKIEKAIRDMETDQRLAEMSLKMAELDLPLAEKAMPLEQESAERHYKHVKEDFQKFLDIDKKQTVESVEFSVKNSQSNLDNQKEELKQLEKMYRSKDLTEETEEIILKRTRFAVEQAEFFLKSSKLRRDQVLNIDLPRREREMRDGVEKAEISLAKARYVIPMSLDQKRLGLEKAKYERTRAREKYENLKKDRVLFTVKAPADGIVYYGKCTQGAWSGSASKMQKGGSVSSEEVFMTIIKPGAMYVQGSVEEKDCRALSKGQPCKMSVPAYPDAKATGEIEKVASVPVSGSYEVRVKLNPTTVDVIPGMSCQVKVVTYEKKDALIVPSFAVFADEADDEKFYVYKSVNGGKPEKVWVKVGKKAGGKTEILDGLKDGDEILKDKPESSGGKEK